MMESNERIESKIKLMSNEKHGMNGGSLITNPYLLTNPKEESKTMESNEKLGMNGGSLNTNPRENMECLLTNPREESMEWLLTNPREESKTEYLLTNPREESKTMKMKSNGGSSIANPSNGGSSIANPCENMDYQLLSGLYRGARKRCLVFDKAGPCVKHLADNSTSNSCMQENDSSQCVFPARIIGLHSNAPAGTPSYYNIANKDSSFYRSPLIRPGPFASFHHPLASSGQELIKQVWEGEGSCRRCNCKKSKCLKRYCECFAAGVYCVGPCACIDCFNKPDHKEIVLSSRMQLESKNPLAFAPKVIRGSISSSEFADYISTTPASPHHKRGCNCKKSKCLKKYCECYRGGVGCSVYCRCEGCTNEYGTKYGSCALSVGHELKEDEISASEKPELKRLRKTTIQNGLEQTMGSALTITPLRQVAGQSFGKSSYFQPTPNFSHLPESMGEGKMSEFVLEGSSNSRNQQLASSSSPNMNRILPPQSSSCVERSAGGVERSRMLILQSIPHFPTLMHKHHNP